MSIVIPEIIIKKELDILIKKLYKNLTGLEQTGTVVDAVDIDAGVTIAVTQQGAVGTPEITDITFPVGAGLDGKSWHLNTVTTLFNVYYTVTGSIIPLPSLTERISIQVNIDGSETAIQIAQKTQDAIAAQSEHFTVPPTVTDTITVSVKETNAEKSSLLYSLFGGLKFDGLDYFVQASNIIKARYTSEARKLELNLGFSPNRENFPQVNILLPNEDNDPKNIGNVQGVENHYDGTFSHEIVSPFQTNYSLFITSDNQNEVIIIYHLLKSLIIMGVEQFRASGFNNIYVGGRDITMDFDLDPMGLYHKTISMSFFYENKFPDINKTLAISSITFTGNNQ